MHFSKSAHSLTLAFIALPLLSAPSAAQSKGKNSLAPSAFAEATEARKPSASELPRLEPSGLETAKPLMLLDRDQPDAVLSRAQRAVRESDRHFQYGKFFLQEQKIEDARREFDLAIDALLDIPEDLPDRAVVDRKFEELVRRIHRYDLDGLGAGISQESPVYTKAPLDEILEHTFPIDPRMKDRALALARARQSQLPLVVNDAVLSYINYFTSERGRRTLIAGLKRAGKYKDMITRILSEEGVPPEMIHLAQAESGFMPRALSRKAAAGMWQFVRARGKEYGLDSSREFDERLDPLKATRAAARHLRDLHNQLGDWHLAMAAYNCGPYCVERAVQRTGYADFWELRRRSAIPKETANYVPAILAMAIVSNNLAEYGISPVEAESSVEFDTIHITAPTNISLIADAADVPLAEIRELNPSLLRNVAPAGYEVHVPSDRANVVTAAIESVPEERRQSWRLHRVSNGDTLDSIAKRYSTAAKSILAVNQQIDSSFFESPAGGEVLLIPASGQSQSRAVSSKRKTTVRRASAKSKSARTKTVASRRKAPTKVASVKSSRSTTAR